VKLGVFPMGVDAARFAALAREPEVRAEAEAIRCDAGGCGPCSRSSRRELQGRASK
jgi:hypothetical protein